MFTIIKTLKKWGGMSGETNFFLTAVHHAKIEEE
ncbi:hypothetical protein CLV59_101166 [Chitinophaga dinghuensis]|uniref:Uncharacterized protein n=1 Tax=Chitinophaga dinghuensis TaxID=1539050 RepID=A0A327WD61_9BACT|nr:hypothetical protein CLV59_101166 [Chitinophaga dinghuensis]